MEQIYSGENGSDEMSEVQADQLSEPESSSATAENEDRGDD
jgi:hypothetical protein